MANVITHPHPQIGFHTNPMHHKPSALGFGFGMSSSPSVSSWPTTPVHTPQSPWPHSHHATQPAPLRSSKRRYEAEDESEESGRLPRDVAMDRSPTPERPKRAAPKRARTSPAVATVQKDAKNEKGDSTAESTDVDVGVLLANLPPQSLLPLLNSLLTAQPSLKSTVLSLIPRPSLNAATEAVMNASRKLLDAYPYSNPSNSFGASSGFGFGRSTQTSTYGPSRQSHTGGMREEYVLSRLQPHIAEFTSACISYLPYFSYVQSSSLSQPSSKDTQQHHQSASHASALQTLHKDKTHPSESFRFLQVIMDQILSQPPLTRTALLPSILPRLVEEWRAWIAQVDEVVNRQGGMFGQETVRAWERSLDEYAQKGEGLEVMREIRDCWVAKVGWLVGRQAMEEL
ncbi:hypothetical protein K474DRAFT_1590181 [Panus rudis PR-1116 ss-1]|nr:hypothetical protein K474DRAFT_1590181 [Panus rudis PR-1116 ss-1]